MNLGKLVHRAAALWMNLGEVITDITWIWQQLVHEPWYVGW